MQLRSNFLFVSIFYGKEKWSDLLQVIKKDILSNRKIVNQLKGAYIFLSEFRGEHIRLALEFNSQDFRSQYDEMLMPIKEYITAHPTIRDEQSLPITRFFCDFPNNEIKYNLFNEKVFMGGDLRQIQLLISRILVSYFDGEKETEEALCSLLISLQEIILDAVCVDEESKLQLIDEILLEFDTGHLNSFTNAAEEESYILIHALNDYTIEYNSKQWFHFLRSVAVVLMEIHRTPKIVYTILLEILRSHLSCASETIVQMSLRNLKRILSSKKTPTRKTHHRFAENSSIY